MTMERVTTNTEANRLKFIIWIRSIGESGKVTDIDPNLLRGVLESMGADFSKLTELEKTSLGRYPNVGKRLGLDAVWGKEKVEMFKAWVIGEYIPFTEKRVGREMRTLKDPKTGEFDTVKHSGAMQFLGELTAFANGAMSIEKYRRFTEDRVRKGREWEFGDPKLPYTTSPHSAFPIDFPMNAVDRLWALNGD